VTHDLASLAYLDLRLAVNRLRLLARNPRRLIPWALLAGWLLFTRVLRGLTYGAPGARHVAFPVDGSGLEPFVPAVLLALLAVPLWTASRRVPLTFASPADGRFLAGSALAPRTVLAWLLIRRVRNLVLIAAANAVLFVAFLPGLGQGLALAGASAVGFAVITLVPLPIALAARRRGLPLVPLALPMLLLAGASGLLAGSRALGLEPALPAGLAHFLLGLPPGSWLVGAYHGDVPALSALAVLLVAAGAAGLALAQDAYPEVWEASTRSFILRRLARQPGVGGVFGLRRALRDAESGPASATRTRSENGRWVPGGAGALVWKEWLAVRRGAGGLLLYSSLLAGGLVFGIVAGLLVAAHSRGAFLVIAVGTQLLVVVNVVAGARLGSDLRNPLWWLSSAGIPARLAAWTVAATGAQALPIAAAMLGLAALAGLWWLLPPGLLGAFAILWSLRSAGVAVYTVFPATSDVRGPARVVRTLVILGLLGSQAAFFGILSALTRQPLVGGLGVAVLALGEGTVLLLFAAGRLRRHGLALAQAEAH